jgi:thiamine biosynthesis lipoprotein
VKPGPGTGGRGFSRRRFLVLSTTLAAGQALAPFLALGKRRSSAASPLSRAAFTMGSIVTVTAYCTDRARCDHAIDEAFREMKAIDALMSVFDPASQVSLLNRKAGKGEVSVDSRLAGILDDARRYNALTRGAFDITLEPLMELYGFRDKETPRQFPADRQIASVLDAVGTEKLSLDRENSSAGLLCDLTKIDLGGIAVGYALDRAVGILREEGIESAIINHSGDIYAIGTPPGEESWEIGITDPLDPERLSTSVRIRDRALSTSGNYRNFVKAGGITVGHILDPSDGRSAERVLSSTAIARTCVEADALSTGFFVLGIERSRSVIGEAPGAECVFISRDGAGESVITV